MCTCRTRYRTALTCRVSALIACGGFSYGDVLVPVEVGQSILQDPDLRDQFAAFFADDAVLGYR